MGGAGGPVGVRRLVFVPDLAESHRVSFFFPQNFQKEAEFSKKVIFLKKLKTRTVPKQSGINFQRHETVWDFFDDKTAKNASTT